MAAQSDRETRALWRYLDHVLAAHALSHEVDDDLADVALMAATAVADRLRLSDDILHMMRASALAEAMRQRESCDGPDRHCDCGV